jgi:hypothetical protein
LSLGRFSTWSDVEVAAARVREEVLRLRAITPRPRAVEKPR